MKISPTDRINQLEQILVDRCKKGYSNFSPSLSVQIIDDMDGTVLFYESAFGIQENEYWYIFTEHHDKHWFHVDDVKIRFFKRISDNDAMGVFKNGTK